MKRKFDELSEVLLNKPETWLITGCAGFIGSNILEALLKLNQKVVGLDNFSTGKRSNLDEVKLSVAQDLWKNFHFIEGDICNFETCKLAVKGVNHVLHQAALGSVPRSHVDPISTNKSNIDGFLNILVASRDENVTSFTYAASSSTYGDHPGLPKVENVIGKPLSPYAITKYVNELYAEVFSNNYGFDSIGLRYFNVFGKRQDPEGAYAAVIPKWISSMIKSEKIQINGDGETSRDFCPVENVVRANILAAMSTKESRNQVYNVAVGDKTTLNELFKLLKLYLSENEVEYSQLPAYQEFRKGDVRHSLASIDKARKFLGYEPFLNLSSGLKITMPWYIQKLK